MFVILSRLTGESKGVEIDDGADDGEIGDRDGDSDEDEEDDEMEDGSDEVRSQLSCSFLLLLPPPFAVPNLTSLIM